MNESYFMFEFDLAAHLIKMGYTFEDIEGYVYDARDVDDNWFTYQSPDDLDKITEDFKVYLEMR